MNGRMYRLVVSLVIAHAFSFFSGWPVVPVKVNEKVEHFKRASLNILQVVDGIGTLAVDKTSLQDAKSLIQDKKNEYIEKNIESFNPKDRDVFKKEMEAACDYFLSCRFDETCDDIHRMIRRKSSSLLSIFRAEIKKGLDELGCYEKYEKRLAEFIERFKLDPMRVQEGRVDKRTKWDSGERYLAYFVSKMHSIASDVATSSFIDDGNEELVSPLATPEKKQKSRGLECSYRFGLFDLADNCD